MLRTINEISRSSNKIKVITNAPNIEFLKKICNSEIYFQYTLIESLNKYNLLYNLCKVLIKYKRNYIHIMNTTLSSFIILNISKLLHYKIIISVVDYPTVQKRIGYFKIILTYYCLFFAYKVDWLYSYYNVFWKNNLILKKSSFTKSSFTDYEKFNSNFQEKNKLILFSGRFVSLKQPLFFLESINNIKAFIRENNYKVILIGDGELKFKIIQYIKIHSLEDIVEIENTNEPSMYFKKSKIFVSLQKYENYPSQSLLEAIASCNYVIATNVGDTERLLNKSNSTLIDNSINSLSTSIMNAILNYENMKEQLVELKSNVMKLHNLENSADYFNQLYFS